MAYSQNGVELQDAGSNTNIWGDPHLNNALKRLNYLNCGYQSIAVTGDYALTSSNTSTVQSDFQAWNALLKFTGALSANATITVPSVSMRWCIWNATNKVLTITTGAGSMVSIDPGDRTVVDCFDATNVTTVSFGGYDLKAYIAQAVLAATGSLPGAPGNGGKYLYCDGTTWLPRQIVPADISTFSASSGQVWAGTSSVVAITPASALAASTPQSVAYAATVQLDFTAERNAIIAPLTGSITLSNPSAGSMSAALGQFICVSLTQDATGSRTWALGTYFKFPGGTPALSTAANAEDLLVGYVKTTTQINCVLLKAFS